MFNVLSYLFCFWARFLQICWPSFTTCFPTIFSRRKKATGFGEVWWVCSNVFTDSCRIKWIIMSFRGQSKKWGHPHWPSYTAEYNATSLVQLKNSSMNKTWMERKKREVVRPLTSPAALQVDLSNYRDLKQKPQQWQWGHGKTKELMGGTIAQYMGFKTLYIF